jgi:FMN phosphatase YigB (HAD superfamily)
MSKTVFVDVDDTLIRSVGTKRIPMPAVVEDVRSLAKSGAVLYLWSSGGAEYARDSARELGIEELFAGFLPKPTAYIDDQPIHEWRFCRHFYPSAASDA